MDWICTKCEHWHDSTAWEFGDDVTCVKCGTVHETDWDYCGEEMNISCWVTGIKKT